MIPFLLVSKLSGALQKLVCPHNANKLSKSATWQRNFSCADEIGKNNMSTLETLRSLCGKLSESKQLIPVCNVRANSLTTQTATKTIFHDYGKLGNPTCGSGLLTRSHHHESLLSFSEVPYRAVSHTEPVCVIQGMHLVFKTCSPDAIYSDACIGTQWTYCFPSEIRSLGNRLQKKLDSSEPASVWTYM
jgi:hypothetical protein